MKSVSILTLLLMVAAVSCTQPNGGSEVDCWTLDEEACEAESECVPESVRPFDESESCWAEPAFFRCRDANENCGNSVGVFADANGCYIAPNTCVAALLSRADDCPRLDARSCEDPTEAECNAQPADNCICIALTGRPFDEQRGCYGAPEPFACTADASRPGAESQLVDADGRCWALGFVPITGEDGYEFSDLPAGWRVAEDDECGQEPFCE